MGDEGEKPEKKDQKEDLKKLLQIVNNAGTITVSAASDVLTLDTESLINLAQLLKQHNKIKIHTHYLKEPELESMSYKLQKENLAQKDQSVVPTQTEEIPTIRSKSLSGEKKIHETKELEKYVLTSKNVHLDVSIKDTGDFVPHYLLSLPKVDFVTRALLDETKRSLIGEMQLEGREIFDADKFMKLKQKFNKRAKEKLRGVLKKSTEEYIATLSQLLVNEMIGLGDLEYLLMDDLIEEVVINSSKDVVWAYHKNNGWIKTNILLPTEDLIKNYSARVAREVGREISHMRPLLDAHLTSGDRVNATLYPISTQGNTMTIRRFSRTPWTAIHLMDPKVQTTNSEAAAFLWLSIQHEMSVLVAGGTASGKTTMLNAIMPFMPANQRIISIEDTRELNLPSYLQWVPLTVRPPTPEGEGEVSMLDLLQNSLRMRPDRVLVGEVRAKRETEVLFEAMHTGHSVYSTFHAERAKEVVDRITSPPMNIPPTVLHSLHLIVVQFRNRMTRQRRTFEICELYKDEDDNPKINQVFAWDPLTDQIKMTEGGSIRVKRELEIFAGMSEEDMVQDLNDKKTILDWMMGQGIKSVNDVGRIITEYYMDKDEVVKMAQENKKIDLKDLI